MENTPSYHTKQHVYTGTNPTHLFRVRHPLLRRNILLLHVRLVAGHNGNASRVRVGVQVLTPSLKIDKTKRKMYITRYVPGAWYDIQEVERQRDP